jgi:hypothetical protein
MMILGKEFSILPSFLSSDQEACFLVGLLFFTYLLCFPAFLLAYLPASLSARMLATTSPSGIETGGGIITFNQLIFSFWISRDGGLDMDSFLDLVSICISTLVNHIYIRLTINASKSSRID